MKNDTIVRAVYRRLLQENQQMNKFAAYVVKADSESTAVIYDVKIVKDAIESGKDLSDAGVVSNLNCVVGYISVKEPEGLYGLEEPCNGAWEVTKSWGPGLGRIVYDTGYALSPTGILMPDRSSVSKSAQRGWLSAPKKGGAKKLPPDCSTHEDEPFLDYSIDRSSQLSSLQAELKKMQDEHTDVSKELDKNFISPKDFERTVLGIAAGKFRTSVPVGETRYINGSMKDIFERVYRRLLRV